MLRIFCLALVCCSVLVSCATPAQKFAATATRFDLKQQNIRGEPFLHRLFVNEAARQVGTKRSVLHVYIDGDGTPWERGRWPANDPTSRNPLILKLLKADTAPALLLGRPCYHGLNETAPCQYRYWTSHRYSRIVVNSMVTALQRWLKKKPFAKITLIGFSGGGTLAVLIASEMTPVHRLITIAANLDISRWARRHGFRALDHSINPSDLPPLPASIEQIHYIGLADTNISAESVNKFSIRQDNAAFIPIAGFDHHCCWPEIWPRLLAENGSRPQINNRRE